MFLLIVTFIAFVIISPAMARRYDTMMVGYDRWIDINYDQDPNDNPEYSPENAYDLSYGGDDPNTVYLSGEPNFLSEYPTEHPNSVNTSEDWDPNEPFLYDRTEIEFISMDPNSSFINEQPEHPNSVFIDTDANMIEIPEEVVWNQ